MKKPPKKAKAGAGPAAPGAKGKAGGSRTKGAAPGPDPSLPPSSRSSLCADDGSWRNAAVGAGGLELGCRVGGVVSVRGKQGNVRYIGPVYFAEGEWVGVHFSTPQTWDDACDGSVGGTRYFRAKESCAVFVKRDSITTPPPPSATPNPPDPTASTPTPTPDTPSSSSGNVVASATSLIRSKRSQKHLTDHQAATTGPPPDDTTPSRDTPGSTGDTASTHGTRLAPLVATGSTPATPPDQQGRRLDPLSRRRSSVKQHARDAQPAGRRQQHRGGQRAERPSPAAAATTTTDDNDNDCLEGWLPSSGGSPGEATPPIPRQAMLPPSPLLPGPQDAEEQEEEGPRGGGGAAGDVRQGAAASPELPAAAEVTQGQQEGQQPGRDDACGAAGGTSADAGRRTLPRSLREEVRDVPIPAVRLGTQLAQALEGTSELVASGASLWRDWQGALEGEVAQRLREAAGIASDELSMQRVADAFLEAAREGGGSATADPPGELRVLLKLLDENAGDVFPEGGAGGGGGGASDVLGEKACRMVHHSASSASDLGARLCFAHGPACACAPSPPPDTATTTTPPTCPTTSPPPSHHRHTFISEALSLNREVEAELGRFRKLGPVGQSAGDEEEVLRRGQYEAEAALAEKDAAMASGDVDLMERACLQSIRCGEAATAAARALLERFTSAEQGYLFPLRAAAKALPPRHAASGAAILAELARRSDAIDTAATTLHATFTDFENEKHRERRALRARQAALQEETSRNEAALSQLWQQLRDTSLRLQHATADRRRLSSETLHAARDTARADLSIGCADHIRRGISTLFRKASDAAAQNASAVQQVLEDGSRLVTSLVDAVRERTSAVFDRELAIQEQYYNSFSRLYIDVGETHHRKALQCESFLAERDACAKRLEVCADSLDPSAAEHAKGRDHFQAVVDSLGSAVGSLALRLEACDSGFARSVRERIVEAGRSCPHPCAALEAIVAKSEARLIAYHDDTLQRQAEGGPHGDRGDDGAPPSGSDGDGGDTSGIQPTPAPQACAAGLLEPGGGGLQAGGGPCPPRLRSTADPADAPEAPGCGEGVGCGTAELLPCKGGHACLDTGEVEEVVVVAVEDGRPPVGVSGGGGVEGALGCGPGSPRNEEGEAIPEELPV